MKTNKTLRFLSRIPLLGDLLEFVYCGLLFGVMIWIASVWRWPTYLLVIVELAFIAIMIIGYFWIAGKTKKQTDE